MVVEVVWKSDKKKHRCVWARWIVQLTHRIEPGPAWDLSWFPSFSSFSSSSPISFTHIFLSFADGGGSQVRQTAKEANGGFSSFYSTTTININKHQNGEKKNKPGIETERGRSRQNSYLRAKLPILLFRYPSFLLFTKTLPTYLPKAFPASCPPSFF